MAKRAFDREVYRPVQASMVAAVLAPVRSAEAFPSDLEAATAPDVGREGSQEARVVAMPHPGGRPGVRVSAQESSAAQPLAQGGVFDPRRRLSREKRFLLSPDEEDRIEDLVRNLARELQTPLKLSHLVRAAVALIARSQSELVGAARANGHVTRPSNGDTSGLSRFEAEVAKLLDRAMRLARPL